MVERSVGRALTTEYVEFRASGERASGEHRCSECCYGIVVHDVLPRCPMCGGETWEPTGRVLRPRPDRAQAR